MEPWAVDATPISRIRIRALAFPSNGKAKEVNSAALPPPPAEVEESQEMREKPGANGELARQWHEVGSHARESETDLQSLIDAWPTLPLSVRRVILEAFNSHATRGVGS